MSTFFLYAVLGLGAGAIYGLLAQGLIVIYRISRVLNFAQGAMAMCGAYLFAELHNTLGWPTWLAIVTVVLGGAAFGALIQVAVMGPMRQASPLARVAATLGIFITLQSAISLTFGTDGRILPSWLPDGPVSLWSGASIGENRLLLLGIGVAVTAVLWVLYRTTQLGRLTTAASQNAVAAAALGHSPGLLSMANWAVGSALAGLCGCLIAPLTGLQISTLSMLVVPALAAAIAGNFVSFPGTFLAGVLIGATESVVQNYVHTPGWPQAVPFIAILGLLVLRGNRLPTRDAVFERLPAVGKARLGRTGVVLICVLGFVVMNVGPDRWVDPLTATALLALIGLSVVVVTGYAGQLNLAPYALSGVSCLLAAHVAESWGWSLIPCLLVGAFVAIPIGLIVAMPALRTRGANLAAATLGLGVVVEDIILSNSNYTGGFSGMNSGPPTLFGWDLTPNRYGSLVIVILALAGLAVVNIRRSSSGRRLLAVRGNERAAASLGVSVWVAKMYAFSVSAFLAGAYGVLSQFQTGVVTFTTFTSTGSLLLVGSVVLAGVGYVSGGYVAGIIATGGVLSYALGFIPSIDDYLPLFSGLALTLTLVINPSGIVPGVSSDVRKHVARILGRRGVLPTAAPAAAGTADDIAELMMEQTAHAGVSPRRSVARVEPLPLDVRGLSVTFGQVRAVRDVDLHVEPGEILGLIGPNGAGKTTAIDAMTGFVNAKGSVRLGGVELARMPANKRAERGLSRSFQAIELFDDLSLAENLSVGSEGKAGITYLRDIIAPRGTKLTSMTETAVEMFGLAPYLQEVPTDLPFGVRRLAGIARCVAKSPSILLLDEPAAGLGPTEIRELDELIRRLAAEMGMGVVLVEHHLELVLSVCDRIQVMRLGETLAVGTPDEVSANPEVRVAYIGGSDDEDEAMPSHPQPAGFVSGPE